MPSAAIVRGMHAFRPSEQTRGAIANTPLIAPSSNTTTAAGGMGPPTTPAADAPELSDDESVPVRPPSVLSSISKRRRSALEDDASTSSFGSKRTRRSASTSTSALRGIEDMMVDVGASIRSGMSKTRHHRRSSAERRIEATALLQEKEDLSADQVIAFADLFEQTTAKADTYMALVREDARKLWVQRELAELGFPTVSSRAEA
jgi:hypothetical protein